MNTPIPALLQRLGIEQLNPMQEKVLETAKTNDQLVVLAPTGSGKTIGFLLPLLQHLEADVNGVQALVITPTRELALQIEQVFRALGTAFKVNTTYGGHSMKIEKNNFSEPPALLIGTPGRIVDHLNRGNLDLSGVRTLVLDEFDKSLEMGFQEDMTIILKQLKRVRKRMLVSATNLETIPAFTDIANPVTIDFLTTETRGLSLHKIVTEDTEKLYSLVHLLCNLTAESTLIFCNHRETVERVSEFMASADIANVFFHGGLEQDERERSLIKFRNGSAHYLVTTDLAARGLDIPNIQHVIHYQLPHTEDVFIHRNGRTARQSATGNAYLVMAKTDRQPDYLTEAVPELQLSEDCPLPDAPIWKTIYIGGGKKDKINKIDVVGFLSKIGHLKQDDIGLITVLDHSCLVAVKAKKANQVIAQIRDQKIKGKKVKMGIAR
jgi:ATP-independent RNA helicase DbpA